MSPFDSLTTNTMEESYQEDNSLYQAVNSGNEELVHEMLSRDSSELNLPTTWGKTPLMAAAELANTKILKLLLEQKGIEPDATDQEGLSVLHYAIEHERIESVRCLLPYVQESINSLNWDNVSPLLATAFNDRLDIMNLLLSHDHIEPDCKVKYGTVFSYVAQYRSYEMFLALAQHPKVNINKENTWENFTPAFIGCISTTPAHDLAKAHTLLQNKHLDVNVVGIGQRTGLMVALHKMNQMKKPQEMTQLILEILQHPSVNVLHLWQHRDSSGHSVFSLAALFVEVLQALKKCFDTKMHPSFLVQCLAHPIYDDLTLLMYAARYQNVAVIQEILSWEGVSINAEESTHYRTAFMFACLHQSHEIALLLLETPLFRARSTDRQCFSQLLYALICSSEEVYQKLSSKVNPQQEELNKMLLQIISFATEEKSSPYAIDFLSHRVDHATAIATLLSQGASPNTLYHKEPVLNVCARLSLPKILSVLLKSSQIIVDNPATAGFCYDEDHKPKTALMWALMRKDIITAQELISAGADINSPNAEHNSVLLLQYEQQELLAPRRSLRLSNKRKRLSDRSATKKHNNALPKPLA